MRYVVISKLAPGVENSRQALGTFLKAGLSPGTEATYAGTHGGTFQLVLMTNLVMEGNQSLTVTVVRAGGSAGQVSVDFATSNLVASEGTDFLGTNGTLVFAAGQRTNTFELRLLDATRLARYERDGKDLQSRGALSRHGSVAIPCV